MTEALAVDRIVLRGIAAVGRHGVLTEEHERAQPFEVDLEIEADLSEAARTDDPATTVDYGHLTAVTVGVVEQQSFRLLETLAGAIATRVLEHPGVDAVTVEVRKVRPPVPHHLESAAVRLRRTRTRGEAMA